MSAPDTNKEKTKAAHKTPIIGMIAAVVFAGILLFALVTWLSFAGNDPENETGDAIESGISGEGTGGGAVIEGTATDGTTEGAATEGAATD